MSAPTQQTSLAERSSHSADCLTTVILGGFGMGLGEQDPVKHRQQMLKGMELFLQCPGQSFILCPNRVEGSTSKCLRLRGHSWVSHVRLSNTFLSYWLRARGGGGCLHLLHILTILFSLINPTDMFWTLLDGNITLHEHTYSTT